MRSSRRFQRVGISALAGAGARVITMLCSLIAVPICLNYLGKEMFGIWATITSLVAVLAFADLGIGNGILNRIATAQGKQDAQGVRRSFASALFLLAVVAGFALVILLTCYSLVPLDWLFPSFSAHPEREAIVAAVLIFAVLFAFNLPVSIIQRVQCALQLGYLNGLSQATGGALGLALVYLVTFSSLNVSGMVGATMLAPILGTLVGAIWMFHRYPSLKISLRDIDTTEVRATLNSGLQFLVIGIAFALCYSADNLIVAFAADADAVAVYTVHQKYFSPLSFLAAIILTPLWPAYAEALAAGENQWIKRIFQRSILYLFLIALLVSAVLVFFAPAVLRLWVGEQVAADTALLIGLGLWVTIDLLGKAISMFLNGLGLIREQLWIAIVFVPVCLVLKYWFVRQWGPAGIPFAAALAYLLVHATPYALLVRRWYRANR